MKISLLIIGVILFFLGAFTKLKLLVATGMILIIMSFFGKVIKNKEISRKEKKDMPKQRKFLRQKDKCPSCGAELLHGDNYCPECGKKILP